MNSARTADSRRDAEDSDWNARKRAAEDRYRRMLAEALKPIESANVLPEPDYESAQSDIAGLLAPGANYDAAEAFTLVMDSLVALL